MGADLTFPDAALEYRFVHASGPGGQHVNKASTAVELRATLEALGLDDAVVQRLKAQRRNRLNKHGELIIRADSFRSQLKNRNDALERLAAWVKIASMSPRKRIATKPSRRAKVKRLEQKKQRGRTKSQRRKPRHDS